MTVIDRGAKPSADEVAGSIQLSLRLVLRWIRRHRDNGTITPAESTALSQLNQDGSCTSAELARREQISPQSMGATTASLEALGLIRRERDPDDGRRIILSLTDYGRQLVIEQRAARTRLLTEAIAAEFTPAELRTLAAAAPLLDRLGRRD